ncbi:MAG: hypothetical protein V4565_10375 [Bacteroidota bacterium]
MLINDPNMPNPMLIIRMFALSLAIVRVLTTIIHEMGHALVGLLFLKGDFDVYIGSYGDPDKGMHFKIGRIRFHFIYDPFSLAQGVFVPSQQDTTHLKNIFITLGGPIASLISAVIYSCIIAFCPIPEVVMIVFTVLIGSSIMDFWYNIKPSTNPIELHNGNIVYNDGYLLKYSWSQMFNKQERNNRKESVMAVDEKVD